MFDESTVRYCDKIYWLFLKQYPFKRIVCGYGVVFSDMFRIHRVFAVLKSE